MRIHAMALIGLVVALPPMLVGAPPPGSSGWGKCFRDPVLAPACPGWPTCDPAREAQWDSWDTEGPSVLKVGSIYHMFYEGDRRETQEDGRVVFNIENKIGHATSFDGVHWTKDARNPVFPEGMEEEALSPTVIHHEGQFWMFYNTLDFKVSLAQSPDGIRWRRRGEVLRPTPGAWDQYGVRDVAVLHDGRQFLLWYTGDLRPLDIEEKSAIGLARSTDGITWEKYRRSGVLAPVLAPDDHAFDDMAVYDPWVLLDEGIYRLWYTCVNAELFSGPPSLGWHICYAWSRDGKEWIRFSQNPILRPAESPFERHEAGTPTVLREGPVYKMWYTGGIFHDLQLNPSPAQAAGIGYAIWPLERIRGDLNADGLLDARDLQLLINMIRDRDRWDLCRGDMNRDGRLTGEDVRQLARRIGHQR